MSGDIELTGNDYVSLPHIATDASIHGVSIVHGRLGGLLEWSGGERPLLSLRVTAAGQELPLTAVRWRRLDRWIPVFSLESGDLSLTGTICAPAGYPYARGFFIRLEIENRGRRTVDFEVELTVSWAATHFIAAGARPARGPELLLAPGDSIILDAADAALAIGGAAGTRIDGMDGRSATLTQRASSRSNSRNSLTFCAGVGRDREGAHAALNGLRRQTAEHWLRQARLELSHTVRSAQDHRWADLLNRNLLFARYFAVGRGIDDDLLYLMRSRSPLCERPALLNEREALFWTIPALIHADPALAREALFRVLETASDRSGEFLRYIDGGAFDTGFVLEQMLLYTWAVEHYVTSTGDESVRDDPLVAHVTAETDSTAFLRLHPEHVLAVTELLPSGDVADFPFSTMANALLRAFAERVTGEKGANDEPPFRLNGAAPEIAAAIWQHCVTDVNGEPVLVSTTNLEGAAAVYDDPSMSLALLPFFGMCPPDDPLWLATMEFLRSDAYPLWKEGLVAGVADRSAPERARTSALCADLLARIDNPLDRLLRLRFAAGVAAASYDPATGETSESWDAALAGLLAWTLVRVAEKPASSATRKTRRR